MLGKRSAHACRLLRAERHTPLTLVDEVVHLFGDDIGGITDSREDTEILKQRGDQLLIPGSLNDISEDSRESAPTTALGRQNVPHAGTGLELGHGMTGYRRGPPCSGTVASAGRSCAARIQPIGVVNRLDAFDGLQHRVQLTQIEQLKLELHLGDTVAARDSLRRHDVDLVF